MITCDNDDLQGGRLSQEDADALFEELEFLQQQVAAKQEVSGAAFRVRFGCGMACVLGKFACKG